MAASVRARSAARARAAGLAEHAERAVGDLGEPATLTPAFAGVDKLFLLTQGIGTEYTSTAIEVRQAATAAEVVRSRFPHGAPQSLADAVIEGFALMRAGTAGFRIRTRLSGSSDAAPVPSRPGAPATPKPSAPPNPLPPDLT